MNEQKNNGKGIFYGVIGVATLIVAIIGATFAYFTASQNDYNTITGNAATISFGLQVTKMTHIDEEMNGMIPMTDGMVRAAVQASTPCKDNNGNAVCQIYKITVSNTGSASIFLDGYVNLSGGAPEGATKTTTDMRWTQVFATTDGTNYTYDTNGEHVLAYVDGTTGDIKANDVKLLFNNGSEIVSGASETSLKNTQTTSSYTFEGNPYTYINNNYVRISGHNFETSATSFDRTTDATNALVYSQYLTPENSEGDSTDLFIVVWLTESGTDQTFTSPETAQNFFSGKVNFNSATGGEVSATFGGYTRLARTD